VISTFVNIDHIAIFVVALLSLDDSSQWKFFEHCSLFSWASTGDANLVDPLCLASASFQVLPFLLLLLGRCRPFSFSLFLISFSFSFACSQRAPSRKKA